MRRENVIQTISKRKLRLKFTQVVKRSGKHSLQGRKESGDTGTELSGPEKTVGEDQCWLESCHDYLLSAIFNLPVARRGSYLGEQAISDRENHTEARF